MFHLAILGGPKLDDARCSATVAAINEPLDLAQYTKGGPAEWTQTVETKGTLGTGDGPYVVDTLTAPEENPYKSWIRFGGMDFFADGKSAALCTWSGDVWTVTGIDEKLEKLTWKRIATGLFQPLGLKIVDGKIYVLGRDGITRLDDLNGDGEADFYAAFNHDMAATTGFHEFAFDLQTDPEGNFYFAKAGAGEGRRPGVRHHRGQQRHADEGLQGRQDPGQLRHRFPRPQRDRRRPRGAGHQRRQRGDLDAQVPAQPGQAGRLLRRGRHRPPRRQADHVRRADLLVPQGRR